MNSKNYQTTSLEHFISLFEKNPLEFPLNILEIKPTHYPQYCKKITKTTQKQGWTNASKNLRPSWFSRLFYRNKTVKELFEENQASKELMNKYLGKYKKINIETPVTKLSLGSRTYINFLMLSEKRMNIMLDAKGGIIGVPALHLFINNLIIDFIEQGNKCIVVINRHHILIDDCFNSFKSFVKNADKNLKVWYLD